MNTAIRPGIAAVNERPHLRIVGAAIRHKDQGWVVVSVRHFDLLMHQQLARMGCDGRNTEQGFVDSMGGFWSREDAWDIAQFQGQVLANRHRSFIPLGRLYSEHLY